MKKNRTPLWAKVLFETPELLDEVIIAFKQSLKIWREDVYARSNCLEWINEIDKSYVDGGERIHIEELKQ